jgi:small redox-active disulfide protein 2
MQVKVLGSGCANCHRLEERANEALSLLGRDERAELVTDFVEIGRYAVMSIPALVVNEQVVIKGRVPEVAEIMQVLSEAAA